MDFYPSDQEQGVCHWMIRTTDLEEPRPNGTHGLDSTLLKSSKLGQMSQKNNHRGITFLDLPPHIKTKILDYAGLLRPCLIHINTEKYRDRHDRGSCRSGSNLSRFLRPSWGRYLPPLDGTCKHPPLPFGVFLASRAARLELATLFFEHNRFSVSLFGRQEYKLFCSATQWGLLHLKQLHILLGGQDRFLKISRGVHRTVLNVWDEFCQNAAERMPSLRCFSMKCKVKKLDVASRLICQMDPFPTLAHCAFHFNDVEDDDIRLVIKRAAWRLTGNLSLAEGKPSFPFMALPVEIRFMVLDILLTECTDPWLPAAERDAGMIGFIARKAQPRRYPWLACCGTCSPIGSICFCETRQTAYSTTCSCFSSPLPYFLVNREFYNDCHRIFFSKNRFTLVEEEPEPVMRFFNSIPTISFMQIRHLSFKIPHIYRMHRSATSLDATLSSWSVLRRFIREHFDLPRLSLSIVIPRQTSSFLIQDKCKRQILTTFLTGMQDLRDFKVYLADDPSFEKELERLVLGRNTAERYKPWPTASSDGSTQSTFA